MSDTNTSTSLSFSSILTLIFVVCKLLKYISWSWWWVFSPILISAGITFAILGIILLIAIIVAVLK